MKEVKIKKISQKINAKVWPFQEAHNILKRVKNQTPEKGYILLETGYGPSGLPHIGTFGEVVKTYFVKKALNYIAPEIPVKILVVSDDYDGMRKIPENIPNQEKMQKFIDQPLSEIPDPFEQEVSYGAYMNKKLKEFLNNLDFDYDFLSASECYKNGKFDEYLSIAAEKYDDIMKIMLPTLGVERQKTYSPFMPIDQNDGSVLSSGVISVDAKHNTIKYKNNAGEIVENSFLGGKCKMQWKPDFSMRWAALDVDYELYGKDHYPNEKVYRGICKVLGKEPPVNFFYELFLDKEGKKISKSKGNGVSMEKWFKYASKEVLSLYMYQKPKVAKRLYFEVIPQTFDEYLGLLKQYREIENEEDKIKSPIFFIGEMSGEIPQISFSMLLNIISVIGISDENLVWGILKKYDDQIKPKKSTILDFMVEKSLLYYKEFVEPNKKQYQPNDSEKEIILQFIKMLKHIDQNEKDVKIVQNLIHDICEKKNLVSKDLYLMFYKAIFGQDHGPRIGSFVVFYGIENTIKLLEKII